MDLFLAGFVAMTLSPCSLETCKAITGSHEYHGRLTTDDIRVVKSVPQCEKCVAVVTSAGKTLFVVGTRREIVCRRWPGLDECSILENHKE